VLQVCLTCSPLVRSIVHDMIWQWPSHPLLSCCCLLLEKLHGLRNLSYLDYLHVLGLETLAHCCLIHDLILCYKYLHGLMDTGNRSFWCVQLSPRTRNNDLKLDKTHCNINARKSFITNCIADIWNSLPAAVVLRHTVSTFKSHLKEFNFYRFFVLYIVAFIVVSVLL